MNISRHRPAGPSKNFSCFLCLQSAASPVNQLFVGGGVGSRRAVQSTTGLPHLPRPSGSENQSRSSGTRLVGDGGPSAKALGDWVRFKYPPTVQGPRRPAHWSIAARARPAEPTCRHPGHRESPSPRRWCNARRNRPVRPPRGQSGRRLTQVSPSVSYPPAG